MVGTDVGREWARMAGVGADVAPEWARMAGVGTDVAPEWARMAGVGTDVAPAGGVGCAGGRLGWRQGRAWRGRRPWIAGLGMRRAWELGRDGSGVRIVRRRPAGAARTTRRGARKRRSHNQTRGPPALLAW